MRSSSVTLQGRYFRGQRNHPEGGYTSLHGAVRRDPAPHTILLQVRCGKCEACKRRRRRIWSERAVAECRRAIRTWLVTLTAAPHEHFIYETRARKRCRQRGYDYDQLSETERFSELCYQMGAELTKYVKRVRKESGARLRALWVFEAHKSGRPHIHGLVHEVEAIPVKSRCLKNQWKDGFSHCVLLTDESKSHYATKYLAKDAECRVRASRFYGQQKRRPEAIADPDTDRRDIEKAVFSDADDETLARWSRHRQAELCNVHVRREEGENPDGKDPTPTEIRTWWD